MVSGLTDPLLKSRADAESPIIKNIEERLASKTFGIPYLPVKNLLPVLLGSLQDKADTPDHQPLN
jgi:arsenite-transporting ATPase